MALILSALELCVISEGPWQHCVNKYQGLHLILISVVDDSGLYFAFRVLELDGALDSNFSRLSFQFRGSFG